MLMCVVKIVVEIFKIFGVYQLGKRAQVQYCSDVTCLAVYFTKKGGFPSS